MRWHFSLAKIALNAEANMLYTFKETPFLSLKEGHDPNYLLAHVLTLVWNLPPKEKKNCWGQLFCLVVAMLLKVSTCHIGVSGFEPQIWPSAPASR